MGRGFSRGFNSGFLHAAETVFSALEAEDTAAFSAILRDVAVLDATEAEDTAAFSATLLDVANLEATEAEDTAFFAIEGEGEVEGEVPDAVDQTTPSGGSGGSSGIVILPPKHPAARATLRAREEPDRVTVSARTRSVAALRSVERPDVARFTGKVAQKGKLSLVEAPDTASMKADPFDMRARNNALLLMAA